MILLGIGLAVTLNALTIAIASKFVDGLKLGYCNDHGQPSRLLAPPASCARVPALTLCSSRRLIPSQLLRLLDDAFFPGLALSVC